MNLNKFSIFSIVYIGAFLSLLFMFSKTNEVNIDAMLHTIAFFIGYVVGSVVFLVYKISFKNKIKTI